MYQVISYLDKKNWEKEIEQMNIKDVHYLYEYCNLCKKNGDGEPYLFIYKDNNDNKVCYTFIKRLINLPFVEGDLFDIITPLGFGGPLYNHADKNLIQNSRKSFEEYCQSERIVSEFTRFNPLLNNHQCLEDLMDITYNREMVFINLKQSEQDIINHYHKKHWQSIKKAIKSNLEFRIFTKKDALEQVGRFYTLYKKTMDKVKASPYYYFSADYVKQLLEGLYNESLIGAVFFDGEMISAALCMYSGGFLHYHLACSNENYLNLGSNMFLLHNLALWGKDNGCNFFFLGGGHSDGDTLFKFKHRFNLEGTLPFYVGKKVHCKDLYDQLVEKWKKYYFQDPPVDFFPAYRPVTIAIPRPIIS